MAPRSPAPTEGCSLPASSPPLVTFGTTVLPRLECHEWSIQHHWPPLATPVRRAVVPAHCHAMPVASAHVTVIYTTTVINVHRHRHCPPAASPLGSAVHHRLGVTPTATAVVSCLPPTSVCPGGGAGINAAHSPPGRVRVGAATVTSSRLEPPRLAWPGPRSLPPNERFCHYLSRCRDGSPRLR